MNEPDIYDILLIDDNKADNFLHEMYIHKADAHANVIAYLKVEEALAHIESLLGAHKELPDVIFLDLNMPKMGGWSFLDALACHPSPRINQLCVVVLTASLNPNDKEKSEGYPTVKEFLTKPLSSGAFATVMDSLFSG
jgi:CheY-like chemotaxis protein